MEINRLPGWLTFRDAAAVLGYKSRQAFHSAVRNQRIFADDELSYVEVKHGATMRPFYFVTAEAVARVKAERAAQRSPNKEATGRFEKVQA